VGDTVGVGEPVGRTVFFGVGVGPVPASPPFGFAIVAKTIPEIIKMTANKICIFFDIQIFLRNEYAEKCHLATKTPDLSNGDATASAIQPSETGLIAEHCAIVSFAHLCLRQIGVRYIK
jgi:hypothetical protein